MKLALTIIALVLGSTLFGQNGSVLVEITDVIPEWGGTVRVGLYDKANFPAEGKALATRSAPAHKLEASVVFADVPVGEYAIAVYQDFNDDEKLNRNFYKAPTEPYGFSKNVFGRFGPPEFKLVAFLVEADVETSLKINLEYK